MQSSVSSNTGSQYLVLCTPSAYALANLLSVCSAMMATENCVMGCVCFGSAASTSNTCCGTCARDRSSADRPSTCAFVGTSPVSRSHSRPSGRGSPPSTAAGSRFCRSGMVCPRNRMPSSASSREVSQTMPVMPRMPPIAMFTVTSPRDLSPCACLIFFRRSCCAGMAAASASLIPARRRGVPSPGAAQESRGRGGGRRRVGRQTRHSGDDATHGARRRHGAFGATCGRPRARVWGVSVDRRYFPMCAFGFSELQAAKRAPTKKVFF
jgi:hypothetical protein